MDVGPVEAGAFQLPVEQVTPRDRDLLFLGVAVETDHFHPVEQRSGDRLGHVRGREEQHLGQVEIDVQVVVSEGVVLRRVEDLEQRRRRVTAPVRAELVDLVEDDDGVHAPGFGQGAHDPARARTDVGASVTPDLGLVVDTTERHAGERSPERPGDGLAQRGLADPGRADERQDCSRAAPGRFAEVPVGSQLANSEELDDAFLHVVEAGVVLVEDLPRRVHVEVVVRSRAERDLEQRVEPGADPSVLGTLVARALQALHLAGGGVTDRVGQVAVGQGLAVLADHVAVALAQLLADGLELAAEQELALLALHAVRDLGADLLRDFQLGQGVTGPGHDGFEAGLDVERLEQFDLALEGQLRPPAGRVGQRAGVADALQGLGEPSGPQPGGDLAHDRPVLGDELLHPRGVLTGLNDRLGFDPQRRTGADHADTDAGAGQAAQHQRLSPVGELALVLDPGHGPHPGVAAFGLGDEEHQPVAVAGGGRRGAGLVGLEGEGHHHLGQDHPRAQGQQRQHQAFVDRRAHLRHLDPLR